VGQRKAARLVGIGVRHPGNAAPDAASPIGRPLANALPHCSSLAQHRSDSVEPAPRLLQPGRGGRLIFQQDLLLEEVAEPFRFGCNPFADRGGG
jgi:hypothetical protein